MVDTARVKLFGKTIGAVRWDDRRRVARFEYDSRFSDTGLEPAPLMMPVHKGRVYAFGDMNWDTFNGLPGLLADALPDSYGRVLFDRWLALTGRTSGNPVEALCYLGSRCMGALEFEPALDAGRSPKSSIEIDTLIQVAREALSARAAFSTNLADDVKTGITEILRLGTSAGGQRAKAVIAYNPTTGEVRSGQADIPEGFHHYLIKLDGVSAQTGFRETDNFGRLEYSFSKLAHRCGIEMTECSLIEENGRAHFLTRRFDREGNQRIHMQTLCGIAHFDFRLHHAYSYEQAFGVMRRLRLPYDQMCELYRRMIFNVVIRNQDDHTKNISFLMNRDGVWRLAPAYDIMYAYNPAGPWTAAHQMSVNGKFDSIERKDMLFCAEQCDIREAKEIIEEVRDCAALWPSIARECEVPTSLVNSIAKNFQLAD